MLAHISEIKIGGTVRMAFFVNCNIIKTSFRMVAWLLQFLLEMFFFSIFPFSFILCDLQLSFCWAPGMFQLIESSDNKWFFKFRFCFSSDCRQSNQRWSQTTKNEITVARIHRVHKNGVRLYIWIFLDLKKRLTAIFKPFSSINSSQFCTGAELPLMVVQKKSGWLEKN